MVPKTLNGSSPVIAMVTMAHTINAATIAPILMAHTLVKGSSLRLVIWINGSLFSLLIVCTSSKLCHHHTYLVLICSPSVNDAADLSSAQDEYPVAEFHEDIKVFANIYAVSYTHLQEVSSRDINIRHVLCK